MGDKVECVWPGDSGYQFQITSVHRLAIGFPGGRKVALASQLMTKRDSAVLTGIGLHTTLIELEIKVRRAVLQGGVFVTQQSPNVCSFQGLQAVALGG